MSHYLRSLITRHTATAARPGATGIVHPRPRSRFEAGLENAPAAPPQVAEPDTEYAPSAVAAAWHEPDMTAGAGRPERHAIGRSEHPPTTGHGVLQEPPGREDAGWEPLAGTPRQRTRRGRFPRPEPAPVDLAPPERGRQAGTSQNAPHQPDHPRDAAHRPNGGPAAGPALFAPEPEPPRPAAAAWLPRGAEAAAEPAQSSAAGTPRGDTDGQPPGPGILQTPDWVARVQSALQQRHGTTRSPEAAEPTVNVTIGRIDIRAVRQQPPDRSIAGPAPIRGMSLDDYLEKRNRGQH